ncbi:MAG TPA: chemotaxis protein CheW [Polyangiaceae bacterium]|nr:chemotaxis protein CheW [Polyangiaceae bacterium]
MTGDSQIVICSLDGQRYGLWLSAVERVIRMPWITPLPDAPPIVLGVVKIRGELRAVVDLRQRFQLPARAVRASDRLLLARTAQRSVALRVDDVLGVETLRREDWVEAERLLPVTGMAPSASPDLGGLSLLGMGEPRGMVGVVQRGDLTFIHDLDHCLSSAERTALQHALQSHASESYTAGDRDAGNRDAEDPEVP